MAAGLMAIILTADVFMADVLMADVDVHAGRPEVDARAVVAIAVMVVDDDRGIGIVHAFGTQVPLSQTCLQTCSALAACESTNHTAAVTTPIRILLIALPLDRPLIVNRVPDIWFRSFQPGAPNLALRRLDKEDRRNGMAPGALKVRFGQSSPSVFACP